MQAPVQIKHRKAPLKTRLWNYKWFYVMFLPVFVALIVFHYLPMFGISLAFFRYQPSKIANPLEFTGLANFQKLFSRPQFWSSFTNTLEISIIKLLLNTFMAVIISLLLNEMVSTKMKKLSQTIIYLPHFMSWVVTAGVFGMLFAPTSAGLVNQVLIKMGLIEKEIYFLGDNDWWRFSYYIINIWHDTGWGTIIFMATLVIWFLQTFDARFNVAESPEQSLLAMIGSLVAPIFAPLGFGDWRVSTALITGFTAKESVVSTLTVLMGGNAELVSTLFTPFTAAVFLVFTLLYTPCVAAIATVKREMGGTKAAVATVIIQCAIAWCVAFLIHAVGLAFGLA